VLAFVSFGMARSVDRHSDELQKHYSEAVDVALGRDIVFDNTYICRNI
jgi:hypothetical protein